MPSTVDHHGSKPEEANLPTLKFTTLLKGDPDELQTLLSACEKEGFFYLDVHDWEDGILTQRLEQTGRIMKKWFDKPLDEKLKTETLSDFHGFKPPGVQSGVKKDTRDGFEALRISRTNLLNRTSLPGVVAAQVDVFESFQLSCHYVLKTLLCCLSDAAGLEGESRYEAFHPDTVASKSTLFFLHHPTSDALQDATGRGHNAHTDVGSFTILFTQQPGLQVLSPRTNKWEWVAARQGCAIINVADTLRFLSKKRFRSAMHRVLPPAGGKMASDRYSTAYFLRAGDSVVFEGVDGAKITAEDYFLSKYSSFNKTLEEQRMDSVATGGMDRELGVAI